VYSAVRGDIGPDEAASFVQQVYGSWRRLRRGEARPASLGLIDDLDPRIIGQCGPDGIYIRSAEHFG
jgi:hypothetical protein